MNHFEFPLRVEMSTKSGEKTWTIPAGETRHISADSGNLLWVRHGAQQDRPAIAKLWVTHHGMAGSYPKRSLVGEFPTTITRVGADWKTVATAAATTHSPKQWVGVGNGLALGFRPGQQSPPAPASDSTRAQRVENADIGQIDLGGKIDLTDQARITFVNLTRDTLFVQGRNEQNPRSVAAREGQATTVVDVTATKDGAVTLRGPNKQVLGQLSLYQPGRGTAAARPAWIGMTDPNGQEFAWVKDVRNCYDHNFGRDRFGRYQYEVCRGLDVNGKADFVVTVMGWSHP